MNNHQEHFHKIQNCTSTADNKSGTLSVGEYVWPHHADPGNYAATRRWTTQADYWLVCDVSVNNS